MLIILGCLIFIKFIELFFFVFKAAHKSQQKHKK